MSYSFHEFRHYFPDLTAIYEHLCDAEGKLAKVLEKMVKLYTTTKSRWQKKAPAPDPKGRDELNKLWDLILCVRKLLLRVEKLKQRLDSTKVHDFGDIQKELQEILKTMAQKVVKSSKLMSPTTARVTLGQVSCHCHLWESNPHRH